MSTRRLSHPSCSASSWPSRLSLRQRYLEAPPSLVHRISWESQQTCHLMACPRAPSTFLWLPLRPLWATPTCTWQHDLRYKHAARPHADCNMNRYTSVYPCTTYRGPPLLSKEWPETCYNCKATEHYWKMMLPGISNEQTTQPIYKCHLSILSFLP